MRALFSTGWIFQGWITHLILTLCAQRAFSRPSCTQNQYLSKEKRCCSKCEPGTYVFSPCAKFSDTKCRPCGYKEYQPDWNNETKCLSQKFCDTGKGFSSEVHTNPREAVPCRCKPGLQCSLINCEYCEKIPVCRPGQGLITSDSGRSSCVACEYGHFSSNASTDSCKRWTNCKALGKGEHQPGSVSEDFVCGAPLSGPSTSWVVVAILSVITGLSLVILFLFCYKDKLNILSVNLRTCVQNLKRTRIQQETLAPPYNSGTQNCTLYELTCLIRPDDRALDSTDASTSSQPAGKRGALGQQEGMEESPKTASEGWGGSEGLELSPVGPPMGPSCSCALSGRQPVEVGENEDCSQAVATGMTTSCSCGTAEEVEEVGVQGTQSPVCELPLSQTCLHDPPGSGHEPEAGSFKQSNLCCPSVDPTTLPELTCMTSDLANVQGLSLRDSGDLKLPAGDSDPEGQHSHCSEPAVTSGQVTGNNNTTFISSGQVMNFSGEVIVVYVSQPSQGDEDEAGGDKAFGSPVQEESSKCGFNSQSNPKPTVDHVPRGSTSSHIQKRSLPVQEVTEEWPREK